MTTAPPRPWYAGGLRFACRRCGDCCRGEGQVFADDHELAAMAAEAGEEPETFAKRVVRRRTRDGSILADHPDLDCILLEDDACIAYDERPAQCRSWPFWRENLASRRAWLAAGRGCEGIDEGPLHMPWEMYPPRALEELRAIHAEVDARIAEMDLSCEACGDCCHFAEYGHHLFVTLVEADNMIAQMGFGHEAGDDCPYQEGARCTAREHRPVGCRTFHCSDDDGRGHAVGEWAVRELKRLSRAYDLPYLYLPLPVLIRWRRG